MDAFTITPIANKPLEIPPADEETGSGQNGGGPVCTIAWTQHRGEFVSSLFTDPTWPPRTVSAYEALPYWRSHT